MELLNLLGHGRVVTSHITILCNLCRVTFNVRQMCVTAPPADSYNLQNIYLHNFASSIKKLIFSNLSSKNVGRDSRLFRLSSLAVRLVHQLWPWPSPRCMSALNFFDFLFAVVHFICLDRFLLGFDATFVNHAVNRFFTPKLQI